MDVRSLVVADARAPDLQGWRVRVTETGGASQLVGSYTEPGGGRLTVAVHGLLVDTGRLQGIEVLRVRSPDEGAKPTVSFSLDGVSSVDETLQAGQLFVERLASGTITLIETRNASVTKLGRRKVCQTSIG